MASLSIHNAILVTATGESPGGVLVGDDGTIEAVLDGDGAASADEVIDAQGKPPLPRLPRRPRTHARSRLHP